MIALASDFDGTLFFGNAGGFRKADLSAIKSFRDSGGLFGICTGRSLEGVLRESEGILDFDFYILTSGAEVLDSRRNVIAESFVPTELVLALFEGYKSSAKLNYQQKWLASPEDIRGRIFHGVSLAVGDEALAESIAGDIGGKYGDKLTAFVNVTNIDVVAKGCSKGEGLKLVKSRLGVDLMGGIGDSFNDMTLIESADRSFSFPYAPEKLREKADEIVENVASALKNLSEYGKSSEK